MPERQKERLTIGAFGRLTGLSVKALRHYDRIGLLTPAAVDPRTGYRLYERSQVEMGRTIRRLRDLELPLEAIRAVLEDPAQAAKRLAAYRRDVQADVFRRQRILHHLYRMIEDEEEPVTTPTKQTGLDPEDERQVAVDLFNHVWELLETEGRTPAQDDRMLHAAHASRFHWENVGEPRNLVIGEWQCSRVYSVLGRAEPAAFHAARCLALCEEAGITGFYRAEAYEAAARARAVAGDREEATRLVGRARSEAESIEDPEERELFEGDISTVPI